MGVRTCAPFTKGSGAPEHRPTTRNIVRSKIFQVRAHLNLFFLKRFRFGIQVQVQVQMQELHNPTESDSGNKTESNTKSLSPSTYTQLKGSDSGNRCKKVRTKGAKRFQVHQKGANRCEGCSKRCRQVQEGSGSGAKKVFQVQVHRRTGRVRDNV